MQGLDGTGERPRGVIASALDRVARSLADIVVPPVCLACRAPLVRHHEVCGTCWRDIRFIRPPLCDRLGLPMPFGTGGGAEEAMISAAAAANPPAYGRARAVAAYDGVMRDLIHAFKYADRHDARRLFGTWLVSAAAPLLPGITMVVPVPLAWTRLLRRQFNQAAILAQETSRLTGLPYAPHVLKRTRATRSQVGLSRLERRRNISGSFALAPRYRARIEGASVLLIDDVITTGATVDACARVLLAAGAVRVDVLALALVVEPGAITL
ncbi:MAG: ComF family protein [Hyphomicrobiaceae bacterium]